MLYLHIYKSIHSNRKNRSFTKNTIALHQTIVDVLVTQRRHSFRSGVSSPTNTIYHYQLPHHKLIKIYSYKYQTGSYARWWVAATAMIPLILFLRCSAFKSLDTFHFHIYLYFSLHFYSRPKRWPHHFRPNRYKKYYEKIRCKTRMKKKKKIAKMFRIPSTDKNATAHDSPHQMDEVAKMWLSIWGEINDKG